MEKNRGKEIAVLLATYNGAKYLVEQLDSLRAQTYQNFVCYIHDDGSNDGTQQIITDYCSKYPSQFIYLGCSRTGGAKYNFMYLLRVVEADYYMFCDQDDVWLPEKIEKTYNKMKEVEAENENIPICVFTDLSVVDANLQVISNSFYSYTKRKPYRLGIKDMLYDNLAYGCAMIFNHAVKHIISDTNTIEYVHMHDVYPSYLSSAIGTIRFIDEPLILYRQHEDNVSGTKKARDIKEKLNRGISIVANREIEEWKGKKKIWVNNRKRDAIAIRTCLEKNLKELNIKPTSTKEEKEIIRKSEESMAILNKFINERTFNILLTRMYRRNIKIFRK